jgi:hypothetical protein
MYTAWNNKIQEYVSNRIITSAHAQQIVQLYSQYNQYLATSLQNKYGNRIPASAITLEVDAVIQQIIQQLGVSQYHNALNQHVVNDQYMYNNHLEHTPYYSDIHQNIPSNSPIDDLHRSKPNTPDVEETRQPTPTTEQPTYRQNTAKLELLNRVKIDDKYSSTVSKFKVDILKPIRFTSDSSIEDIEFEHEGDLSLSITDKGSLGDSNTSRGKVFIVDAEAAIVQDTFSTIIDKAVSVASNSPDNMAIRTQSLILDINDSNDSKVVKALTELPSDSPVGNKLHHLANISSDTLKAFLIYVFNDNLKRFLRHSIDQPTIVKIDSLEEISEFFDGSSVLDDFMRFDGYSQAINTILRLTINSIDVLNEHNFEKAFPKLVVAAVTDDLIKRSDIEKVIYYMSIGEQDKAYHMSKSFSTVIMKRKYIYAKMPLSPTENIMKGIFTIPNNDVLNRVTIGESLAKYTDQTVITETEGGICIFKNGVFLDTNEIYYFIDEYL